MYVTAETKLIFKILIQHVRIFTAQSETSLNDREFSATFVRPVGRLVAVFRYATIVLPSHWLLSERVFPNNTVVCKFVTDRINYGNSVRVAVEQLYAVPHLTSLLKVYHLEHVRVEHNWKSNNGKQDVCNFTDKSLPVKYFCSWVVLISRYIPLLRGDRRTGSE